MAGATEYRVGYQQGEAAAENRRRTDEIVSRVFYGRRPVQVDQSYIDRLHALLEDASSASGHNDRAANQFHAEAVQWKAHAQNLEGQVAALKTELAALSVEGRRAVDMLYETDDACQRDINRARAELAGEREAHHKTAIERDGMQRFLFMATLLLRAEGAGKARTPEYAEMKELALEISDTLNRGEPFHGYHSRPEKLARMRELWMKLLPE